MNSVAEKTYPQTVRRLSLMRLSFVLLVIGGISYYTWQNFAVASLDTERVVYTPWFAPYVDVTSVPSYAFEKRDGMLPAYDAVLAFIVADGENPCLPTWGNYYTLDEAAESLDLDRRIARLQQQEGRIAISFGGALNKELGFACTDEDKLKEAYESVIERYKVSTIDLDLERESLADEAAGVRRARVIAALQADYRDAGKPLVVWLTLPVAPYGLTKEGTDAVRYMLDAGVDLAGVNVMTMDYGGSKDSQDSMYEASRKALIETHRQLGILYRQVGIMYTQDSLWGKIGATPMIGQNDVVEEIFTIEDAQAFNNFVIQMGVGRMSMWSANRDIPCGENYVDVKVVSDVCSGVTTAAGQFAAVLSTGFTGDLLQQATMVEVDPNQNNVIVDDPKTSPYQIWRDTGIYVKGTKVVWRGNVYEAKWWTSNDVPDNPVLQSFETPWQLVGPVLPGDKPMKEVVLPPDLFPAWSGQRIYEAGDTVVFEGTVFRAKWWNQGESPAAAVANPQSSPWVPLTDAQVEEILERR